MKTEIRDLDGAPRDPIGLYGGKSGPKYGIVIGTERWMVKFPESTRGFPGLAKGHVPPYTTSPISEYIGSQVYASLGIPVHETELGMRSGKIVVACKDFDPDHELLSFGKIKNSLAESEGDLIGGSSSGVHGEFLHDALAVIEQSDLMRRAPGARERFWDMFVVDAFIRNNDRNNANWGVLADRAGSVRMAPVFDNGNAFFNKRNPSAAAGRPLDADLLEQDALGTNVSFFLDDDGHHIHPFDYIGRMDDPDCTAALVRFARRIDMGRIREIVEGIPEEAFGLAVIAPEQKEHYIAMMETAVARGVNPVLERLGLPAVELAGRAQAGPLRERAAQAKAAPATPVEGPASRRRQRENGR